MTFTVEDFNAKFGTTIMTIALVAALPVLIMTGLVIGIMCPLFFKSKPKKLQ